MVHPRNTESGTSHISPADFFFGDILGEGAYAKVYYARKKSGKRNFAVKVMDQYFIRKEKKINFVLTERKVMSRLSHPSIVKCYSSFRDSHSLYLVMELCRGGNLYTYIRDAAKENAAKGIMDTALSLPTVQFYAGEVVIALQYLHSNQVIHRDLKPDNLLLTADGHIKVSDFGSCKDESDPTCNEGNQFCGTVTFVSPEVLKDAPATRASDLWALGVTIYQMLTGITPFEEETEYLTFKLIAEHDSETMIFPSSVPLVAQDLIRKLLRQEPNERIGARASSDGYNTLKQHPFFSSIQSWDDLLVSQPPIVPPLMKLNSPRLDGASKHWAIEECFMSHSEIESQESIDIFINRPMSSTSQMASRSYRPWSSTSLSWRSWRGVSSSTRYTSESSQTSSSLHQSWLKKDEEICLQGKVKFHSTFFRHTRVLVLTDTPRLLEIGSWSNKIKRELPLNRQTKVMTVGAHTFDIHLSTGVLRVTDDQNSALTWERALSEQIVMLR